MHSPPPYSGFVNISWYGSSPSVAAASGSGAFMTQEIALLQDKVKMVLSVKMSGDEIQDLISYPIMRE
jgi:hypothetical protein